MIPAVQAGEVATTRQIDTDEERTREGNFAGYQAPEKICLFTPCGHEKSSMSREEVL
jgi:hypothetical protein